MAPDPPTPVPRSEITQERPHVEQWWPKPVGVAGGGSGGRRMASGPRAAADLGAAARAGRSADARADPARCPTSTRSSPGSRPISAPSWAAVPRGRFTGGRGLALIGLAVVALWLASGIYRVQPDEQGVVLRFGAFNRTHAARAQLPPALADRARR